MGGELAINGKTINEISDILKEIFDIRNLKFKINIHNVASRRTDTIVSNFIMPLNIANKIFGDYKTLYCDLDVCVIDDYYCPIIRIGIVVKE